MLIVVPRATTEKITQKKKKNSKKAIRELKCYTRKYLFNVKKKTLWRNSGIKKRPKIYKNI